MWLECSVEEHVAVLGGYVEGQRHRWPVRRDRPLRSLTGLPSQHLPIGVDRKELLAVTCNLWSTIRK